MKISIILPIYKVEPWLERCIRSLLDQDLPPEDYEIIAVNDGSPDNSREVVLRLQQEASNIILIEQENQGVSAARNHGLEVARGEYILFIDPDDYVLPGRLSSFYERVRQDDLDILLSGRSHVWPDGKVKKQFDYSLQAQNIHSGVSAFFEKDRPYVVWDSSVGRLYRRSLIEHYHILFPVGVAHIEDGVFVRKVFTVAQRVGFEDRDCYQVFLRPGSATRSDRVPADSVLRGYIAAAKALQAFKAEFKFDAAQLGLLNESIAKYALLPLMSVISHRLGWNAFYKYVRLLRKEGFTWLEPQQITSPIYLHGARIYNISPWFFGLWHIITLALQKHMRPARKYIVDDE